MCSLNKILFWFVLACQINTLVGVSSQNASSQKRVTFNLGLVAKSVSQFSIKRFLNLCASSDFKKQRGIDDRYVGDFLNPIYREIPVVIIPGIRFLAQTSLMHHTKFTKLFLCDIKIASKLNSIKFGAACGSSDCSSQTISPKTASSIIRHDFASMRRDLEGCMSKIDEMIAKTNKTLAKK